MCTVSLIPPADGRGVRLVVNRDERRTRLTAWAPRVTATGDVSLLAPVDADAGGTWVAASSAGLIWALLNMNATALSGPYAPRRSRGLVIPALAAAATMREVERRFGELPLDQFAPFRLLAVTSRERALCSWDGTRAWVDTQPLRVPEVLSSSSLGDHLVEGPREQLFHECLGRYRDSWRAQDHFHQHAWPDRRHLSVLMTRTTARTVSRTVVVAGAGAMLMTYAPVVDGWIGPVVSASLPRPLALARSA